jgi:hypothetical protein
MRYSRCIFHFHFLCIHIKYSLLGLFPLRRVTFGTNLGRKQVKDLQVPFAKLVQRVGDPFLTRWL